MVAMRAARWEIQRVVVMAVVKVALKVVTMVNVLVLKLAVL